MERARSGGQISALATHPGDTRLDTGHVASLMEVIDRLPPVLVDQRTMSVIDGVHRLEAFRMAGRSHIEAALVHRVATQKRWSWPSRPTSRTANR